MKNILTIAIVGLTFFAIAQAPNNKGTAKKYAAGSAGVSNASKGTEHDSAEPPTYTIANQTIETKNHEDKTQHSGDDIEVERQLAQFTKDLVWVGILQFLALAGTLVVVGLQAKIMGKHAEHLSNLATAAGDNAKAASLNAQAVINSERPWIDVSSVHYGDGLWRFDACNYGRTPAEIVSTSCRFQIVDDLINGLTEPPLYRDRTDTYKRFVFHDNLTTRVGSMAIKTLLEACPEKDAVLSGAKAFIIIGRVVYYDVLNRVEPPHETRYCYGWNIHDDTLFSVGPSGYHDHT